MKKKFFLAALIGFLTTSSVSAQTGAWKSKVSPLLQQQVTEQQETHDLYIALLPACRRLCRTMWHPGLVAHQNVVKTCKYKDLFVILRKNRNDED